MSSEDPSAAVAEDATWGGWMSSVASSVYETVAGTGEPAPENFESLSETALTRGAAGTNEFSNVDSASRQALWKQLLSVVGMDVMNLRLSLPIWVFEPTTALSRMAEMFQYSNLLDRAAKEKDPVLRDALVAAFLVSAFAHTERVRKPFNPVQGETFEFNDEESGLKFLAEQVSHHPPISAAFCEGKGWSAAEAVDIKATYLGNSIEISNSGEHAERFVSFADTGDLYTWNLPTAVVTNLFIGGTFVDHYGTIELTNTKTGSVSKVSLTKCGWFSAGRYEVSGAMLGADGVEIGTYSGMWNKYCDFERSVKGRGEGSMRLWAAGKHLLPEEEGGGVAGVLARFTRFGEKLLRMNDDSKKRLPPTDSRFRPDRLALQLGDSVMASEEKMRVEQVQRDRRAKSSELETEDVARWFTYNAEGGPVKWERTGDYWAYAASLGEEQRLQDSLW